MSTYLVAFIVGEFEAVEGKSKDGTLVRCYTPMGKTEQGKFALETSIRSIEYYTEFFGVEYPLPKYFFSPYISLFHVIPRWNYLLRYFGIREWYFVTKIVLH